MPDKNNIGREASDELEDEEMAEEAPGTGAAEERGGQEPGEEGFSPEEDSGLADSEAESEAKEMSEEEARRRIEEQLEKITVLDVVMEIMVTLSSLAYQKFGLPKEVNAKYRDLEQAKLAIDCLGALISACESAAPPEKIRPISDTLANLRMLYIKESE